MSGDGVAAPDTEDALVGFRVLRRFAGFGEFWGTIGRVPAHLARNWYRARGGEKREGQEGEAGEGMRDDGAGEVTRGATLACARGEGAAGSLVKSELVPGAA